jgi:hypothetical protein
MRFCRQQSSLDRQPNLTPAPTPTARPTPPPSFVWLVAMLRIRFVLTAEFVSADVATGARPLPPPESQRWDELVAALRMSPEQVQEASACYELARRCQVGGAVFVVVVVFVVGLPPCAKVPLLELDTQGISMPLAFAVRLSACMCGDWHVCVCAARCAHAQMHRAKCPAAPPRSLPREPRPRMSPLPRPSSPHCLLPGRRGGGASRNTSQAGRGGLIQLADRRPQRLVRRPLSSLRAAQRCAGLGRRAAAVQPPMKRPQRAARRVMRPHHACRATPRHATPRMRGMLQAQISLAPSPPSSRAPQTRTARRSFPAHELLARNTEQAALLDRMRSNMRKEGVVRNMVGGDRMPGGCFDAHRLPQLLPARTFASQPASCAACGGPVPGLLFPRIRVSRGSA